MARPRHPAPEVKLPDAALSTPNDGKAKSSETSEEKHRAAHANLSTPNNAESGMHNVSHTNLSTPEGAETTAKSEPDDKNGKKRTKLSSGARNLIILGVSATFIAFLTTTIGLTIYHVSGDIYLDRSRPGYLPDESEVEEESETEPEAYNFETSGSLSKEVIEEYLQHLTEELNAIDSYKDPFADSALSDDRLGIPKAEQPEQPEEPAPN